MARKKKNISSNNTGELDSVVGKQTSKSLQSSNSTGQLNAVVGKKKLSTELADQIAQQEQEKSKQKDKKKKQEKTLAQKAGELLVTAGKEFGNFATAANKASFGAAGKEITQGVNAVATGFNKKEADKRTKEFIKSTNIDSSQGVFGKKPDEKSLSGKAGNIAGTAGKFVVDAASMILPAGAAQKAVKGSSLLSKINTANKAGKVVSKVTPHVAGSVVATGVGSGQDVVKGNEKDLLKNVAVGTAVDLAIPVAGKVAGRVLKASQPVVKAVKSKIGKEEADIVEAVPEVRPVDAAKPLEAPIEETPVVRADKYEVSAEKSRVKPEEAITKLKEAGYSQDETRSILQDALPEKGLSMPGSPKKIGLNDKSIKEAAHNFDKTKPIEVPQAPKVDIPQEITPLPEPKSLMDKVAGTKAANYLYGDKQIVKDAQVAKASLPPEVPPTQSVPAVTPVEGASIRPLKSIEQNPEQVTSKLATSVKEGAVHDKLISKTEAEAQDLPTFDKANMKEQAQYSTDLIKSSPQEAIDIAMGRKAPPEHILPQMVFNAVEEHARAIGGVEGGQLLKELASSRGVTNLRTMAQNVRAAAERDPHSPTTLINDLKVKRAQALENRGKSIAKTAQADRKAVKAATPKVEKETWDSFIKGLEC